MNDIELRLAEHEIASRFPRNQVGRELADQALVAWRARPDGRDQSERLAGAAAAYAHNVLRASSYFRDVDMDDWFSLPSLGIEELSSRHTALIEEWRRMPEEDEEEAWRREEEQERIDRLEDEGAYGRTLAFTPESERWLFIRFGQMPSSGRSKFGLVRDDTEDGPDPWRTELGGMTHEAGVSVFRAYRHPDIKDAYVLIAPSFHLARYGVDSQVGHLMSVIPHAEAGEAISAFMVDGSLATSIAADCTLRVDLGSDGEYLIDTRKAHTAFELPLNAIWATEKISVPEILERHRGWTAEGSSPPRL